MNIAVTGGTGFLGRYIIDRLVEDGHWCRCWFRASSDRTGFDHLNAARLEWIEGDLASPDSAAPLVEGCDAVVHSALYRPGAGFRGAEGDVATFVERNVLGTIRVIDAARAVGVPRFVFISTCAVHERILDDRKLDEAHPLWALTHYGAHKAAIEKFVHSYGFGHGYAICSLRPTGIYAPAHPIQNSKWYDLIQAVKRGEAVEATKGGKEVHAADVAKAVAILLGAPAERITGEAFNCYDRYISDYDVATVARELCGGNSAVSGESKTPKHQIDTTKLRSLGMEFGGDALLRDTVQRVLEG
jgi:nucleoside-diphosphate-sugar epimerase